MRSPVIAVVEDVAAGIARVTVHQAGPARALKTLKAALKALDKQRAAADRQKPK